MRIDELPRSDRIEDRRGGGAAGFPTGRAGGLGLGTIIVLCLVGWALGINPLDLIGGAEILTGQRGAPGQSEPAPPNSRTEAPSDQIGQFVSAVLGSTEVEWKEIFAQAGKTYEPPTLVMFSGATRSACGFAQSAMGPFYCPVDRKVYLDTSFFEDLQRRFHGCDVGSKSCEFSQAYVITHEIGHHVQNMLGILPRVQEAQRGIDQPRPISSRCALSCRPIASPESGLIAPTRSGASWSRAMWKRRFRPRLPSATTAYSGAAKATSFPTLSPMAPRSSARAGW